MTGVRATLFRQRSAAAALVLGLALGSGAVMASTVSTVQQRNKLFEPARVEIPRGGTIAFTNDDPYIHHLYIESPNFNFDSGDQRPGKEISIRFDQAGSYVLRCAIHLKMQLDISVR